MNIKVTADSTCDLPQSILDRYHITLVPLTVEMEGKDYIDGVTITPAEIFAHVAGGGNLCSTAAPSVVSYQETFAKYAGEYDGVIHINIGADFSSSHQHACLAAESFSNVRVINSDNLTTGQGFLAVKACQLAGEYDSLDALVEKVKTYIPKVEASFLLNRLDYMVKGGRCSSATALGANLLNLKPCIEVKNGKMAVVKKYRGSYAKCLANYVKDRLKDREDLDRDLLFLIHTPVEEDCRQAVLEAISQYGHFAEMVEGDAGCTVSCHCGPGTLGIIFLRK